MRHFAKYVLFVVLALALVVSAFGCATEPAAPTSAPAAPTTAPAPANEATQPPAAEPTEPAAAPAADLPSSITIAAPSAGSADYTAATAMAKVGTDASPIRGIVQPFAGPAAWIPQMMSTGKPEIGIMNSTEAWQAYTGKAAAGPLPEGVDIQIPYSSANPDIRMLLMGPEMTTGFVVRKDSSFQNVTDLKGATITWGYKAQVGGFLSHLANLAMAGLTKSDFKGVVEIAQVVDGVRAVAEGRADSTAVATSAGIVAEVDAQVGLRYIDCPNDPERLKDAQIIMPGCHVVTIKGGSAAAVVEDTDVIGFGKAFVTKADLSEDAAYALVKAWFENYDQLVPMDKQFERWSAEQFVSTYATVPYHPGAIRFYKEKGLWTAEMEKNQEILLKGDLPMLQ